MSDIKNLFAETFEGLSFSQFPESDLLRLGIKHREKQEIKVKQKVKRCRRKFPQTFITDNQLLNKHRIIPFPPPLDPPKRYKFKQIKHKSILEEMEAKKARHKLYYHSHKEELKWKRLVKEGRTDIIEQLLSSVVLVD